MAEGDPVYLGFDTWGSIETSTAWRGRLIMLFLRVVIGSGGVDINIMEMPFTGFSPQGPRREGYNPCMMGSIS